MSDDSNIDNDIHVKTIVNKRNERARGEGGWSPPEIGRKGEKEERIFCYARKEKISGGNTSVFGGPFRRLEITIAKIVPNLAKPAQTGRRRKREKKRREEGCRRRRKVAMKSGGGSLLLRAKTRSIDRLSIDDHPTIQREFVTFD